MRTASVTMRVICHFVDRFGEAVSGLQEIPDYATYHVDVAQQTDQ